MTSAAARRRDQLPETAGWSARESGQAALRLRQYGGMVAFASRRLESLFGPFLELVSARHIHALVETDVAEAFDLDFKQTVYGRGDSDRRALAGDVAAMANTAGGVIVLGVEEDTQARAAGTPGVSLADAEIARMRQVVASLVSPMPEFHVQAVPENEKIGPATALESSTSGDPDRGYYVIAVPRSPGAPHAVLVNDALRYPTRNGATTRYLSEPEVATAYQQRAARAGRQADRLDEVERYGLERLEQGDSAWISVSAVPGLQGHLAITSETFQAFQNDMRGHPSLAIGDNGRTFQRFSVRTGRLIADNYREYTSSTSRGVLLDLHSDGSGFFAVQVHDWRQASMSDPHTESQLVDDESIALGVVSGLIHVASHARDRAGAGGIALVRAQLIPAQPGRRVRLGHGRAHGFPEAINEYEAGASYAAGEVSSSIDDLADANSRLVAAAALLLDQLAQACGIPEMAQFNHDGQIRHAYWNDHWRPAVIAWANEKGIELIN